MESVRIDLLPLSVATWAVGMMALAATVLWLVVRRYTRGGSFRVPRVGVVVARVVVAVAAAWCWFQLGGRFVVYASEWPLWLGAVLLGGGVELVAAGFELERRSLGGRLGVVILVLRAVAVGLVVVVLLQPVVIFSYGRKIARRVAVVVDGSESMRFRDEQWLPEERLGWARYLGLADRVEGTNAVPVEQERERWQGLGGAQRMQVDSFCETTRVALACDLLVRDRGKGSFLQRLGERYDLDLFVFGRSLSRITEGDVEQGLSATGGVSYSEGYFRSATDVTAALEGVLKEIPSEQLAGVVVLSDGIHNSDTGVMPLARRYAAQGVPVASVVVGGGGIPFDIAVADVSAPESLFLGDSVRLGVVLRASGAVGRKFGLQLLHEGEVVEEREVEVSSEEWQREVRLTHKPETNGVMRYEVRCEVLEGELFSDNNSWSCDVAVSDERINVLLVDSVPRWEFRYLRNLFFGRDKSVHLQSWLVEPDQISGVEGGGLVAASAGRSFGDAESGGWPVSRTEWRAFDVIIVGDVSPGVLSEEVAEEIYGCVVERGALLVTIAGPRAMPHAYGEGSKVWELVPYTVQERESYWLPPERSFRLQLTPLGRSHQVMVQSGSMTESEEIWHSQPLFDWRLGVTAKGGSEVLAVAAPDGEVEELVLRDVSEALSHLDEIIGQRNRHAVVTAQRVGRGKVLGLAFDQSWRLRYRIGDTRHHRFWGQILRWGLGERLRSGGEELRVGTDQMVYGVEEPLRVVARVVAEEDGASGAEVEVVVESGAGEEVLRSKMRSREEGHGVYEVELPPLSRVGEYVIRVRAESGGGIYEESTGIVVSAVQRPVEMGSVRPQWSVVEGLARGTGGVVVGVDNLEGVVPIFGAGRRVVEEEQEYQLWNNPVLLVLLLGVLTLEWSLRKRGGLA